MSLVMTSPTKHPKSGAYRLRLAIPFPLRDTAARLHGSRCELIESLGTKDAAEARRLAPAALARLHVKLSGIRAAASGEPVRVTERDVQALAGERYRAILAEHGDDPGEAEGLGRWLGEQLEQVDEDPSAPRVLRLTARQMTEARDALRVSHLPTDRSTVERMAEATWRASTEAYGELERRAVGDWSPSAGATRFPTRAAVVDAPTVCTFDTLLRGWGADRGWAVDAKPINRNLYDRHRTLERLAGFLGHRNASAVAKADVVRWKEDAQRRGLKVPTVRNDLSEMSAVWTWGVAHGLLPDGNPFAGLLPPKPKSQQGKRRAWTDGEATAILMAARECTGLLRWLPWVCCLTGARLNEITQSVREDVTEIDGVTAIRIHDEGNSNRSLKNAESRRTVPLHPMLIAEGFLVYVQSLPPGSPLFPDVRPDSIFARRADTASKRVGYWLRHTLKITDATTSPSHSWRHWFIDACRKARIHQEVRSALTGHSAKVDEGAAYGGGMGSFVALLAEEIAKVLLPVGLRQTRSPTLQEHTVA